MPKLDVFTLIKYGFVATVLIVCAVAFAWFFMQIPEDSPLGIDLIFYTVDQWDVEYHVVNGLRNPPWSAMLLVPFGSMMNHYAAWGILVFVTLIVLVLSVPQVKKKWLFWLSVVLLITAFQTLRVFADAQLEVFIISGVLLVVGGYKRKNPYILAAGILLATTKPQAVFMLMLILPFFLLRTWQVRDWLKSAAVVLVVVVPTLLWRGREWLAAVGGTYQAGGIIDSSLRASLNRLGFMPPIMVAVIWLILFIATLTVIWFSDRTLTREKAAFLVASSLLLAPYAGGNTLLVVVAVGIIPLLQKRLWLGLGLFVLIDIAYPFNSEAFIWFHASYWTLFLLLMWGIFTWWIYQHEIKPQSDLSEAELNLAATS